MKSHLPSRFCLGAAFALLVAAAAPAFARALRSAPPPPAPRAERSTPPRTAARPEAPAVRPDTPAAHPEPNIIARPAQNQEHMQQWMDHHSNLSLPEQQRALENNPGFRELPRQLQQYELNELARLYNMNPQQRARTLQRNEALERLSPPQRQQYRDSVQQLNAIPMPRRRVIVRAILDLRGMPPDQRQLTINSPVFSAQFSDPERSMLSTILTVEPYTPHVPNPAP
jgi:hypothetical protein